MVIVTDIVAMEMSHYRPAYMYIQKLHAFVGPNIAHPPDLVRMANI